MLGADCYVWVEVQFLGSSSNLLALYKSDTFTASVGTDNWFQYQVNNACDISSPVSIGDPFFNTYAPTGTVSQFVAPVGTTTVRYRFVYVQVANEGGSCYFDSAVLNQVSGPVPPVISSLFPLNMIFVNPSDGISFNVSSPSGFTINNNAIGLVVNGVNVSGSLAISGSSIQQERHLSRAAIQHCLYRLDHRDRQPSTSLPAPTPTSKPPGSGSRRCSALWEAEDFDFTNGMLLP